MSQAEIAGGQVALPNELPAKGQQLRDFELSSTDCRCIRLFDYRGRRNLVLVFTDEKPATEELLSEMATRYQEFIDSEAEIIAIAQPSSGGGARTEVKLPYATLLDEDGRIHRQVGATDSEGRPAAAVYIADRFAQVFEVYRTSGSQLLPTVGEILNWLEFINMQCPECEPPEWPLEALR